MNIAALVKRGFLVLLGCLVFGCRTPAAAPRQDRPSPPPLALETFDEVWRILHENHFDTNFNGNNWLEVKERFRPRVQAAKTQAEAREITQQMLKLLSVSHLALVPGDLAEPTGDKKKNATLEEPDEAETGTVGLEVRYSGSDLLVTRVEPGFPADQAGVHPGWILTKVENRETAPAKAKIPKDLDERRRDFLAWRAVSKLLAGPPSSAVRLEFIDHRGQRVQRTVPRSSLPGEAIQFGSLPVLYAHLSSTNLDSRNVSIGLIRFNIWMLPTAFAFHRAIDQHRQRDGIIIDLRGNVGGVVGMIIGVAGHFVRESMTLGTLLARDNTLKLPANPRFADATGKPAEPFAGPLALLVDEITASASEVFAGGLQEGGRVRVFGRTTAGQALPAVYDALPNGDLLYHPVADFITPKGVRFEGRGVIPDVLIPLDRAALLRGADPVLEEARRWIATAKKE